MRRYHLVIVTALVGAIAACLMVRTPNASASSESVTYIPSQTAEARPSLIVAQAEPAPEGDAAAPAPAVENAPPNDPVLNEALAQEQEPAAPAPTSVGLTLVPNSGGEGLLIQDVDPNSAAADKGFAVGDTILEVNNQPVSSVADFEKAAALRIRDLDEDPAGSPSAGQLIRDARTDLVAAAKGDMRSANERLLANYLHTSRFEEHLDGFDAADDAREFFEMTSFPQAALAIRSASSRELENARQFLRSRHELVERARALLPTLPEAPQLVTEIFALIRTNFDTRSPDYDPDLLLVGLGPTLALLAAQGDKPH